MELQSRPNKSKNYIKTFLKERTPENKETLKLMKTFLK